MKSRFALALLGALLPVAVAAQTPRIEVDEIVCLPNERNAVIKAAVAPEVGGSTVRLYFRRLNPEGTFYYNQFHSTGDGNYWTVFPKPEDREQTQLDDDWWEVLRERDWVQDRDRDWLEELLEEQEHEFAEYFVAVHESGGERIARSPMRLVQVRDTDDCDTELDEFEHGWSENLTVGETHEEQYGDRVYHWLCDGIVTRIDNRDVIRADEYCRACVVALLPGWVAPASALAGASVVTQIVEDQDAPSASPSRP